MLCQYKDIFGKPNEGIHQYRLFGIAIVDLIATIAAAILIGKWLETSWLLVLVILLIIGELLHMMFCVDTAVLKLLS